MTETATTAFERLGEFDKRVEELKGRLTEIEGEKRKAARALKAAEGKRLDLERARGAGEEVPEKDIAAAVRAVEKAREGIDEEVWSARLQGAQEVLDEARTERQQFVAGSSAELAAELVSGDELARDSLVEAWTALQEASGAYARQVRRWHRLARFGVIDPETIPPGSPLQGDFDEVRLRFDRGIPVPTPPQLR
jgi:hypothetical protein